MRSPLIHIGYHKTATTWLQKRVFQPEHGYASIADHAEIFDTVVRPHGLVFDPDPFRDMVIDRMAQTDPALVPVVSSEILSGLPFAGGRESDTYAIRLHDAVPEALILITIRTQMRILPSVYMQYLFRGGRLDPKAFFAGETEPGYFGFDPVHFEYDRLIAHYQGLFGRERVFVLTQESLVEDVDTAMARLAGFAGASRFETLTSAARAVQSASYPEAAAPLLRRTNHLRRTVLNPVPPFGAGTGQLLYRAAGRLWRSPPLARRAKGIKPVSAVVKERFAGRFTQSNRRMAELCENWVDLSAYD